MQKILSILTNNNWLLFSLALAFLCFYAFNRGAVDTWIYISAVFVLLHIVTKNFEWHHFVSLPFLSFFSVFMFLIIISLLTNSNATHYRNITNARDALLLFFCIHCFFIKENNFKKCFYTFFLLLVITGSWHAFSFYSAPVEYVRQTNKHILSNFIIMAVPFLSFYLFTIKNKKKYILTPLTGLLIIVCLDILLKAQSRPAFLALFFSCLILIFFTRDRKKIALFSAGLLGIAIILTATNYAGVYDIMKELALSISQEERVVLGYDSLRMIKKSDSIKVLFGHGIGSFRYDYSEFASASGLSHHVFPHNFPLQLVYESGLIGFSLIFVLFGFMAYLLIRQFFTIDSDSVRIFSKCLLFYYIAWLFHCGVTVGFFSSYTLYPLAFTLGGIDGLYIYNPKKIRGKRNGAIDERQLNFPASRNSCIDV